LKKSQGQHEDAKTQIAKLEESEKEFQNKLTEKVDSGHENVKKFVDVHKTNEELTEMLNAKNEQCKKLEETIKNLQDKVEEHETTIDSQKTAYEVLLSTLSDFEENTKDLKE